MDLKVQPKPEIEFSPADKGIVSRRQFFVKKKIEEINQYFFPAHFIREWKPKAELIYPTVPEETSIQYECDFNRDVQNCFVEDYAEEVFLRTPPPCFVVFGKFKRHVSNLCEKLRDEYGSVLIIVDDIVNQVIRTDTDTSRLLVRILRLGVSLTLNFILALLSYIAHTAEARHRGYILCGLPCIPLSHDLSVEQQFNYLFTWENKPTVFINVLFDDEDLIKDRTNLRVELREEGNEKLFTFHSLCEEIAEEEDESDVDNELMLVKEDTPPLEPNIDVFPSRPWPQLPRDEESRVWYELELFDNIIRPVIELINSRVDPQYFITVDSRVNNEFEVVLARLRLLHIWKAPTAVPFFQPKRTDEFEVEDQNEEKEEKVQESDYEAQQMAQEPPQTAFLTLFSQNTISPKFRWELSHYNYICPVSLREGEIVEGKSAFAVRFMKYIYFLRDEKSLMKFIQNPRAYVLPIRPKPLCRFIVLGFPFSGKTTLANNLATEFSIPLIDLNVILTNDLKRKKNTYREFCQQKAECREIIRLTAHAWKDWRVEEEQRITLIEEWILYIQTLLSRRVEQFYSAGSVDETPIKEMFSLSCESVKISDQMEPKGSVTLEENAKKPDGKESLEVRGTAIEVSRSSAEYQSTTPSNKLVQAIKHEDFDFNKNGLEVDANLFFSSLWNSFSGEKNTEVVRQTSTDESVDTYYGEDRFEFDEDFDENISVNWCNLLPPQSLSSFLLSTKSHTKREKRQSFKIFLEAASKVYWEPSAIKTEFAKWRLPCFMDIPLCEIFLENPILLLKYLPEWLKERPLIPDPVDPMHPSILEASRKAFQRAEVVNIKQSQEEIGILLHHAVEKAEREGMRVTGEVISPGGWVVDNMSLDAEVWNKLACENMFADHVYILIDTEPNYRRIINTWWAKCGMHQESGKFGGEGNATEEEEGEEEVEEEELEEASKTVRNSNLDEDNNLESEQSGYEVNLLNSLAEYLEELAKEEEELDDIYFSLQEDSADIPDYFLPYLLSIFRSNITDDDNSIKPDITEHPLEQENFVDDRLSLQSLSDAIICTGFYGDLKSYPISWNINLGNPLVVVTSKLLNFLKNREREDEKKDQSAKCLQDALEFFLFLLTLPKKLDQLKEWLNVLGRGATVDEIEITGKTPEAVFMEIRNKLMEPFIKKPRELENFEIEEIKNSSARNEFQPEENEEDAEYKTSQEDFDDEEDLRIFGESGPLCIVNLERDIFLPGKPEFALRYYGKLYYFWDQNAKNKFIEDPEKYAPYYSAIRCYPPLRVYITGPTGSGKTTLARSLSQQCGLPVVHFPTLLLKNLVPYSKSEDLNFISGTKLLLSEDHNAVAQQAKEQFLKAPYLNRMFWFENSLYSNFFDKQTIINRIMDIQQPSVYQNFPELTYSCIESLSDETSSGEERSSTGPSALNLPKTPYTNIKDNEMIISNYLNNNSSLTDYCIEKCFKPLWTEEPYIRQGFILESFPMKLSDVAGITENNWIPDLVVELVLPENEVIERSIDTLMESWDTKLKRETAEEKVLEDTLINFHKALVYVKKLNLMEEKCAQAMQQFDMTPDENEKTDSQSNEDGVLKMHPRVKVIKKENSNTNSFNTYQENGLPEDMYASIEAEVEEILSKEYPPLVFNPIFETYDAGKARIIDNIIKIYRRDSEEIQKLKTSLKEVDIPWYEINSMKSLNEIKTDLFIKMDKIRRRLAHKGEFAFTLTMEMAEKLLQQGYYFLSKFGRWCPVQVHRMKNPIHMFRPFSERGKVTPIAYRNYIYFVAGENEKIQFLEDPIKYTFNQPHHPNIPLRIAIIGPPKSGKTTLSRRLGITFDLKVITMGSALRFVLEKTPQSTLAKSINSYLKRGCFLPLSLKVEALMICLNESPCFTQGFVFDGLPFDAALTQSLAERGKLPFVIISLVADSVFGKTARQDLDLTEFRLPYKNRINLDTRYQDWNETYKRFAQWNQNTYNNLYEVNAKLNVVDIFYQAYDIIRKSFFAILYYVQYCVSGRVLPLQYLCVSQHEYELRKSQFHNNCPVCWLVKKKLRSSVDPTPRSGLVQYGNHFYWVCPIHLEKFEQNPKLYTPPHAPRFPEVLPKRLNNSTFEMDFHMKIHGYGRCPVTRTDFPSALDWEGSWDFAASYGAEVFLCKNEKMLCRFLEKPWRYYKADTQFEVNRPIKSDAVENLGPPKMTSLPPIGFLEQTVADLIHDCLQLLGTIRPIYPNMNPSVTGCILVALYLKVYNKRNKASHLEKHYLDFMLRFCKSYSFKMSALRLSGKQMGQGDYDFEESTDADFSLEETDTESRSLHINRSTEFQWKVENQLWSAKKFNEKYVQMKLTPENELIEIPIHPKVISLLRFEQNLRNKPIPPVSNCINFIYSVKPNLRIGGKFNYNTLYQQPLEPLLGFTPKIMFNPAKKFAMSLYDGNDSNVTKFSSEPNLHKGKRFFSDNSLKEYDPPTGSGNQGEYMSRRFIPRFNVLDKISPEEIPQPPAVVLEKPLIYHPHRDYAYMLLFTEFFGMTHVLRSYEWSKSERFLEYSDRLHSDLEMKTPEVDFIFEPQRKASGKSWTSIDTYQKIFDAASSFTVGHDDYVPKFQRSLKRDSNASILSFVHRILNEKIDDLFDTYVDRIYSYDASEIKSAPAVDREAIVITEVLTYPPLSWDIISRPYYAYRCISSIFQAPTLDNFAHERHFSLLDGIMDQHDRLRFLQFSSRAQEQHQERGSARFRSRTAEGLRNPHYFVYDFFNLPWSAFLTFPHSGVYESTDIVEISRD